MTTSLFGVPIAGRFWFAVLFLVWLGGSCFAVADVPVSNALHPAIVECLANEALFDGYECQFIFQEGVANDEAAARRGDLQSVWAEVSGTWARDGHREWVISERFTRTDEGKSGFLAGIPASSNACASDGALWLSAGQFVVTIETPTRKDDRHQVFPMSPWCSLGFLSSGRLSNNPGEFFAFVLQHPQFGRDVTMIDDETSWTFALVASEGPTTQVSEATVSKAPGALPIRFVTERTEDGVRVSRFESHILASQQLDNGCVFPSSVVAYYHPWEYHPYFRVVTFRATEFSRLEPGVDPLLFTASRRIQLHNNVDDDHVSGVFENEKIFLSDLPALAGRVEQANRPRMARVQTARSARWVLVATSLGLLLAVSWLLFLRVRAAP